MNVGADLLAKSIIGKNSLSECTVAELQGIALQYPYFGPVHFLLAQKLKEEDPVQYEKQYQKTFLYFQNPLWLEYISGDNGVKEISSIPETGKIFAEKPVVHEIDLEKELKTYSSEQAEPISENKQVEIIHEHIEENEEQLPTDTEEQSENLPIPQLKIQPIDPATQKLSFEPYHTVDYFASQGIRLTEADKPTDKFGKQLKSFTEWLKTMKRLPESGVIAPNVVQKDPEVDQLAENSIVEKDVITEAMAEVWEKQGNHEKAIETYRKLSLLNTDKSSYFAAKIEHLKQL